MTPLYDYSEIERFYIVKNILTICFLLFSYQELFSQITYDQVLVDYDSAIEYKNLKLIPVRRKGPAGPGAGIISLNAAIKKGLVQVSERGTASIDNVHWLRINNNSKNPIFITVL